MNNKVPHATEEGRKQNLLSASDLTLFFFFCTPYLVFAKFFSWNNSYKDFHCLKFSSAFGATASPHRYTVLSLSRFIHHSVLPANGTHSGSDFGA